MDEDKKDIEIIRDNVIKLIKTKRQEAILSTSETINQIKFIQKSIDELKFKEIYDAFNKELNWFFAISVGTSLWILGNFDKFIAQEGSMLYKAIYILSILLVSLSSVILACLQGKSLWIQSKHTRFSNLCIMQYDEILRVCENYMQEWDILEKKINSLQFNELTNEVKLKELSDNLNKLKNFESMNNIKNKMDNLNKLFKKFGETNKQLISNIFSEKGLKLSVSLYIFGVIFLFAYILIFIVKYVV